MVIYLISVIGHNTSDGITANNSLPGDVDLNTLIPGYNTFDGTILEFDFIPQSNDVISFQYVFTSDEYNEYTNTSFNDVFGYLSQWCQRGVTAGYKFSGIHK